MMEASRDSRRGAKGCVVIEIAAAAFSFLDAEDALPLHHLQTRFFFFFVRRLLSRIAPPDLKAPNAARRSS